MAKNRIAELVTPAAPAGPVGGRAALLGWLARIVAEIHYVEDSLPRIPGLTPGERRDLTRALSSAWYDLANAVPPTCPAELAGVIEAWEVAHG